MGGLTRTMGAGDTGCTKEQPWADGVPRTHAMALGAQGRAPGHDGVDQGGVWDGAGCAGGLGQSGWVAQRPSWRWADGPPGSWVELRCGPGCPEPELVPSRFSSCHADVERMLLEAQLETESGDR